MKILVTGGLGYIGSHTVVALQAQGYEVLVVDNLSNTRMEVLDGIAAISGTRPTFVQMDLRDKAAVHNLFTTHADVAAVIHFAASKAVGESVDNPLLYYENNLNTLVFLLQALGQLPSAKLIFSSSCTVYGQSEHMPVNEQAPILPAFSPYGNTKQIGEEIIHDTARAGSLQAILLRYFNPIGAHPTAYLGELPNGVPQNLVPFITQTVAGLRPQLSVYGNDYPTPDGTAIRDYIHVVDLAEAHVVAMQRLLEHQQEESVEVFNVGTGEGSSVLQVIEAFEQVTGMQVPYSFAPRREGDVICAYADTRKATQVLGWKTRLSLHDALRDAWAWEKKIRNLS